jgi:hypothetical protein
MRSVGLIALVSWLTLAGGSTRADDCSVESPAAQKTDPSKGEAADSGAGVSKGDQGSALAPKSKSDESGSSKAKGETTLGAQAKDKSRDDAPVAKASPESSGPSNDAADARAEALAKLKTLTSTPGKTESASDKALREVLEERLRWLDERDKAAKALHDAEHPAQSPERALAQVKTDLERVQAALDQANADKNSLLPEAFRTRPEQTTAAIMDEMKQAIDTAQNELKQATSDLESYRNTYVDRRSEKLSALRIERDQIHQRVEALPARRKEREAAEKAATSDAARAVAHESLANIEWEARAEEARLKAKEAQIALEDKRTALIEPEFKLRNTKREIAKRTLEAMQERHRIAVDHQQQALRRAAEHEEVRAEISNDPLERYRRKQTAELYALKAQMLNDEHLAEVGPSLALDQQRDLTTRARQDFDSLKRLVEEGRATALVALRLKNDYRRLSVERAAVARTELARATDEMTRCENMLTAVELDLVNDSRDERFILDGLLEQLPPDRRAQAIALAADHEIKHRALLDQRCRALEKLAYQAQEVHTQVQRRLEILDEQYAFVRTKIFWMRDEEPLGPSTFAILPRECRRIARVVFHSACEAADRSAWQPVRVDFALLAVAVFAIPWPLHRGRVLLARLLQPAPDADSASNG